MARLAKIPQAMKFPWHGGANSASRRNVWSIRVALSPLAPARGIASGPQRGRMAFTAGYRHPWRPTQCVSAEPMNLPPSCGDKRLAKPLIGTVINIPAASVDTVAASAAVAMSAFLWKPLT